MVEKLLVKPQDEKELVELKNNIAENEVNLSKLKSEIIAVLKFLELLDE
jgi:hypothetical protein